MTSLIKEIEFDRLLCNLDGQLALLRQETIELLEQRDKLMRLVIRLYSYIKPINHIHLPDQSIIYASEIFDVLSKIPESRIK